MGAGGWSRRSALAGLTALAGAAPLRAFSQIARVDHDTASRIGPASSDYTPSTSLKTVLDGYRRMTCPVSVQGSGPFGFVADTGANQSVISTELAAQLGLMHADDQALNGVAGVQVTPTVRATMKLGRRAEREAILSVLPADAIGAQGMLGLDQLDGGRLTLDFAHGALTLDEGPALPGDGEEYEMRASRKDGQLFLVDTEIASIRVAAFVDSGAEDTIGNMALRALAYSRYPGTPWRATPIVSVTGQTIDAQYADLPTLRIGEVSLPTWPVAFADLHTFRMWNLINQPAILIGVDVLSRFPAVCLDFRHDAVRFRMPNQA